MADWLNVSTIAPRIAYIATAAQTAFTVPFVFFVDADLFVYKNTVLLTLAVDYTVTGAESPTGGTVTLLTGATLGDEIMIVRELEISQTTHIPPSGPLDVPAINIQFSRIIAMIQQIGNFLGRAIHFPDSDSTLSGELAPVATRKNRLLGFGTTGELVYPLGPSFVGSTSIGVVDIDSTATAQITTIPGTANIISTSGLAAPGDGGGGTYKRVGAMPVTGSFFQSADGAWWALVAAGSAGGSAIEFATRAAAVAASISADATFIRTAGYSTAGDGGEALYKRVTSLSGATNGFQSADGAWWQYADAIYNAAAFGAFPDFHEAAALSATVGGPITGSATFTAADVGALINLTGAGVAGADYFGAITGFNVNSVSVSPSISTAVTSVYGQWGQNNTSAIQAAIDAARVSFRGGTVLIPASQKYCVTQLDCTNTFSLILKGASGAIGSWLIPMRSTNSVIDATGTESFNMRDLSVGFSTNNNPSKQIAVPKVGLLIAPSTQTVGRDFINIENVYWTGRYSVATAYLDRASSSTMRKVGFSNYQQTPLNGTFAGVMTYNNALSVTSDFATTHSGIVNFSDWSFFACEFHSIDFSAGVGNQAVYLDNVREVQFFGGNMSSSSSSIINLAAGTIQNVLFQGVTFYSEMGPAPDHVIGGAGGMARVGIYFALLGQSGTTAANIGANTDFVNAP